MILLGDIFSPQIVAIYLQFIVDLWFWIKLLERQRIFENILDVKKKVTQVVLVFVIKKID